MAPVGRVIGGLVAACACLAPATDAFFAGVALPSSRAAGETAGSSDLSNLSCAARNRRVFRNFQQQQPKQLIVGRSLPVEHVPARTHPIERLLAVVSCMCGSTAVVVRCCMWGREVCRAFEHRQQTTTPIPWWGFPRTCTSAPSANFSACECCGCGFCGALVPDRVAFFSGARRRTPTSQFASFHDTRTCTSKQLLSYFSRHL